MSVSRNQTEDIFRGTFEGVKAIIFKDTHLKTKPSKKIQTCVKNMNIKAFKFMCKRTFYWGYK